jgi:hypothetical protein
VKIAFARLEHEKIRDFVLSHPEYKFDSIVSNKIAFDLVKSIENYQEL